LGYVV